MERLLSILITLLTSAALANTNPVGINVSGRIVDDTTNTALSGSVSFKVSVMSPNNCVLYSEEFNNYTVSTNGTFTFTLGTGSSANNAYGGTGVAAQTSAKMKQIFSNNSAAVTALANGFASGASGSDGVSCPGTYTPGTGDFRKVRIEFDAGGGYAAILPFHVIRAVPYAMVADEAQNANQLGGSPAADYAKMTDLPDLTTGVPAAETDPNVQAFAKTAITGLTAGSCGAGKILTFNGTTLECVTDGGSGAAYTLPVATSAVLGGVMVPGTSDIAVDASGNLTLKNIATSKVTGLDTALTGTVKYSDMPGTSCAAGEALVWTSPANTFSCYSLTIAQSQVTNLTTDLAAKLPLAGGTMTGALNMGGQDVLATGHITMSNQKTITIGKYDQTQENTLAGTLSGTNEGATWYNSAMKALRFWDGTARQTVVSTSATCADGQILKWNDTTKVWYCAADSGAGGADASSIRSVTVSATAPTTAGQVLRYDGTSSWVASLLQAADLPSGIARSKVATGTANHVVINDGTGALSSEAQLAVSRGGTGQSTYTDGQLLIGKTDGTLAKANITAGSGVTVTNGDGTITIAATAVAPSDAGYGSGNKGIVAFNTDAATSGISVASGVATVNTGTAANQIVKLDGTAKLPAVDGSALTNVTVSADHVTSGAGKYLTYAPNNVACANGEVLKKTANGWECGSDSAGWTAVDSSYAAKGYVQFLTDAATSGITVSSGVANVNTGTGANQIVKLDGSAKLPAVDGSALTNLDVSHVASGAGKYFTYAPNNVACANGEVLKKTANGWECGADAGAGGADASSIRGQTVNNATALIGNFMQFDGTKWDFVSMPVCTADKVLTFNVNGIASCTDIAGLTNTSIAAGAAIARSKLASGTANHVLINDGTGVMSSEAQLAVSRGGTGQSTYTDGQILVGKTDGTLAKTTITAGSGVTVTNGDGTITIAASAASDIVDGSIVDADVNASAAIARTKLASGTANRLVVNNGSGVMSDAAAITASRALVSDANGIPTHATTTATEIGYVNGVTSSIQNQLDTLTTNVAAKVAKAGDTMTGNLVMNAQKEVRFADSDSSNYIGLRSPATVASDVTFTLPATDGTANYVLKTDGSGNLGWVALPAGTVDASYAAKGIVQFNTDADTSGVTVAAGVATLNTGTTANKIVKLDGTAKLPAVDGSALTNVTVVVDKVTSAVGKYFTYAPNGSACANGEILKKTANGWECGTDAGASGTADADKIRGVTVAASAGTPADGSFLKYNNATTSWEATTFIDCVGAGKTINYNVTLNTWNCVDIAVSSAMITDGTIVNADIAAAAAIARTKLASGTANHVLINDGSGVMSSEAQLAVSRGGTGQSTYTDGQILVGKTDGTLAKTTITAGSGVTVTNGDGTITIAASAASDIVDGSIVDADVNASAAIARTKLANGTANRIVVNNGSGVMSDAAAITASRALVSDANGIPTHATTTATEIGYVNGVTSAIQTQIDGKVAKAGDTMTGNLVMNAQKEVRFADSDSSNYIGLRSPATVGTNVTFTLPTADGTANYVLKTDGSGNLGWVALPSAASDASYSVKGVVQFLTDAATSGITVSSGVANVNTGTAANQIVKLDASAKLPAVDGSALTNVTVTVDNVTNAAGKYFKYRPNNTACTDGYILKWDNTNSNWICAAPLSVMSDAGYGSGNKGIVAFNTDAATSGISLSSGVATVNYGTGANQIVKLDASSKLPAVDGSALTNLSAANISAGTLPIARGGTGATSFSNYGLIMANSGATALTSLTCAVGESVIWTVTGFICGKDFYQTGSASSANYIRATGAAASSSPIIDAAGSDTNIDLKLQAKGTGTINLQSKYLERSPAAVSGNQTIPADTNFHSNTLTAGVANTITLPDPTGYAANTAFSLTVKVKQPSSGADGTITWATQGASVTIKWDSGTAPSPATGNNKEAIYQFLYLKNENIWYAMQVWKEN